MFSMCSIQQVTGHRTASLGMLVTGVLARAYEKARHYATKNEMDWSADQFTCAAQFFAKKSGASWVCESRLSRLIHFDLLFTISCAR